MAIVTQKESDICGADTIKGQVPGALKMTEHTEMNRLPFIVYQMENTASADIHTKPAVHVGNAVVTRRSPTDAKTSENVAGRSARGDHKSGHCPDA